MKNLVIFSILISFLILISSCATTHPNEALIVGAWKPVKVEKYFTDDELEALKKSQNTGTGQAVKNDPKTPATGEGAATTGGQPSTAPQARPGGSGQNPEAALNGMMQAETRTNMVIYPDKTAAKFYRNRTVKASWKLKGNGTVLIARDLEKKDKYRIDILEVNPTSLVVVQNLPVGGIKITYEKTSEGEFDQVK